MTPHELTTLLAEPASRQFDEPYKMMLFDRAMVWYERLARNTLDKDPKRRKEFIRSVILELNAEEPLETTKEVPAQLFANGISFDFVGSVDGSQTFTHTSTPSNLKFFRHNKYQKNILYYTYINNKIQVYDNSFLRRLRIDAMFINPKIIAETSGLDPIEFMNTDMKIPGDIMQLIIQSMEQSDLQRGLTKNNKDEVEVTNED